jgi:hypothetical protein
MKLRMYRNSVRLRLNQAEVAQFSKTGYVEETVEFVPGTSLTYVLESSSTIPMPQASYKNGELRVQIPTAPGMEWATGEGVGVSGEQPLGSGETLSILIEKDFQCVHGEADPKAYPNPLGEAGCE